MTPLPPRYAMAGDRPPPARRPGAAAHVALGVAVLAVGAWLIPWGDSTPPVSPGVVAPTATAALTPPTAPPTWTAAAPATRTDGCPAPDAYPDIVSDRDAADVAADPDPLAIACSVDRRTWPHPPVTRGATPTVTRGPVASVLQRAAEMAGAR